MYKKVRIKWIGCLEGAIYAAANPGREMKRVTIPRLTKPGTRIYLGNWLSNEPRDEIF